MQSRLPGWRLFVRAMLALPLGPGAVAAAADGGAEAGPICRYDFSHPAPGHAGRELDLARSGVPLGLINGGAAMRVADEAFPGAGPALETRQINPAEPGNDDWKAGVFTEGGEPGLAAFAGVRGITIMAWVKPAADAPNPAPASGTPRPDDVYPAVGLFGLLTGDSDGHYSRALVEVLPLGDELRLVALGRRLDAGKARVLYADGPWQTLLPPGRWTHVAATFDFEAGTMVLYRDGRPLAAAYNSPAEVWEGAGPCSATPPAGIKVGGSHPQNTRERNPFNGRLDELMFFNRALDADEVRGRFESFGVERRKGLAGDAD